MYFFFLVVRGINMISPSGDHLEDLCSFRQSFIWRVDTAFRQDWNFCFKRWSSSEAAAHRFMVIMLCGHEDSRVSDQATKKNGSRWTSQLLMALAWCLLPLFLCSLRSQEYLKCAERVESRICQSVLGPKALENQPFASLCYLCCRPRP